LRRRRRGLVKNIVITLLLLGEEVKKFAWGRSSTGEGQRLRCAGAGAAPPNLSLSRSRLGCAGAGAGIRGGAASVTGRSRAVLRPESWPRSPPLSRQRLRCAGAGAAPPNLSLSLSLSATTALRRRRRRDTRRSYLGSRPGAVPRLVLFDLGPVRPRRPPPPPTCAGAGGGRGGAPPGAAPTDLVGCAGAGAGVRGGRGGAASVIGLGPNSLGNSCGHGLVAQAQAQGYASGVEGRLAW
jgi:hypothetical protein